MESRDKAQPLTKLSPFAVEKGILGRYGTVKESFKNENWRPVNRSVKSDPGKNDLRYHLFHGNRSNGKSLIAPLTHLRE